MLLVGKSKNVIKLKVSDLIKYIYLIDPDFNIYKNSETMDNVKRVDFPHESHSRSMAWPEGLRYEDTGVLETHDTS